MTARVVVTRVESDCTGCAKPSTVNKTSAPSSIPRKVPVSLAPMRVLRIAIMADAATANRDSWRGEPGPQRSHVERHTDRRQREKYRSSKQYQPELDEPGTRAERIADGHVVSSGKRKGRTELCLRRMKGTAPQRARWNRDERSYGNTGNTQYFIALVAIVPVASFGNRAIVGGRMRSRLVSLAVALTVAAAACDTTRAVTATDRAALQQHEAQWAQRSFHSYVFDYSETQISTNFNVQITVVDDTVSDVVDLNTGQPPTTPRTWPTIDALFNEADFAVLQGGVSLEYDDQYGYLTLFSIQDNNPGGQFLARVSNLQPLE
jgi:hypothetical protein